MSLLMVLHNMRLADWEQDAFSFLCFSRLNSYPLNLGSIFWKWKTCFRNIDWWKLTWPSRLRRSVLSAQLLLNLPMEMVGIPPNIIPLPNYFQWVNEMINVGLSELLTGRMEERGCIQSSGIHFFLLFEASASGFLNHISALHWTEYILSSVAQ